MQHIQEVWAQTRHQPEPWPSRRVQRWASWHPWNWNASAGPTGARCVRQAGSSSLSRAWGKRTSSSHYLHRCSARPCHRKGHPAVETGFDMQCIDARYGTVPASMVVRAAPHWRPPSTCAPPNITDAHTTTTGIKASRLPTPLYQTKARTARRHSSTNTARRMAWSPFILTWAKTSVYHPEHRIF